MTQLENSLTGNFKRMMINMLKIIKNKVSNMQDRVNNFIRGIKNVLNGTFIC